MSQIRILIVEDEPLIAEDLSDCLTEAALDVVGIAYNGEEALHFIEAEKPDAALLDINLGGGMDGVELATIINHKYTIPFVFLTSHTDKATIDRVMDTFPAGYLVKPFRETELLPAIELAVAKHMRSRKNKDHSREEINQMIPTPLSAREFEVFKELKEGRTNKQIAEVLHLSVNTVKTHLLNIYEKLDVRSRTEALFRINQMVG